MPDISPLTFWLLIYIGLILVNFRRTQKDESHNNWLLWPNIKIRQCSNLETEVTSNRALEPAPVMSRNLEAEP